MYINSSQFVLLKRHSKQLIRTSKPNVILVGAIFCALSIMLSLLSSRMLYMNMTEDRYTWFMNYYESGSFDQAMRLMEDMLPSGGAVGIRLLLEAALSIVSIGFDIFLLRTVRRDGPSVGNLLDGFGFFWRILLLDILTDLFIFLWSMLLFVPGIIAALSYRMAGYLLIDHPEYSVRECIRQSKRMMQGHKMELFCLELSFIGWLFLVQLSAFPGLEIFSLLQIWTVPYMSLTFVLYYEALRTGGFFTAGPQDPPRDFFSM